VAAAAAAAVVVVTGLVVRGRLSPGGYRAIGDPGGLGEVAAFDDRQLAIEHPELGGALEWNTEGA
jgi:hypothetical protein